jgi:hypothetical protein
MSGPPTETIYFGLKLYEFLTLAAIVIGPVVAVSLQLFSERRRRKLEQQTQTMRMLVSTRHLAGDPNYTTAINMIPVDFNRNRKIMAAWQAYIEAIRYEPSPGNEEAHYKTTIAKQTHLIFLIMQYLGYKLAETDIQTTAYAAGGFVERDKLMIGGWLAWPRIADALEAQNRAYIQTPNEPDSDKQ